ncbi:hypothetical protein PHAMO_510084 [Magnetospirillum molischianum DSM 120]|uniref:Uncharacterized protein n=1 Tax=Magnetospirillum molischianum DSM 120 TaxID=1150626 RepID=H8FX82_MAGML|nr:hypothetical protein PHAMO_510084 [Magnetospirillum molischianum DSM 120]
MRVGSNPPDLWIGIAYQSHLQELYGEIFIYFSLNLSLVMQPHTPR